MSLNAKRLEEWITLAEAANMLGVSPQAVHQWCENGTIAEANLRHVGQPKKIFLVYLACIEEMVEQRKDAAADRQEQLVRKDRDRALRRVAGKPQLGYLTGENNASGE